MRANLLTYALLLALVACASHPSRCGRRLAPINRQSLRHDLSAGARGSAAQLREAMRP